MILRTPFLEVTFCASLSRGRDKFRRCYTNSRVTVGAVFLRRGVTQGFRRSLQPPDIRIWWLGIY